jgi:HAD superfamily phosphatase (TIGR01668 family)
MKSFKMACFKRFTPTYYAKKLLAIPPSLFAKSGYKVLFIDLDNTLASYDTPLPSQSTLAFIQACIAVGLTITITSNNSEARVLPFAQACGVEALYALGKPFSSKLLKYCQQKGYAKEESLIIGDQLLTDVLYANRLGFDSLFIEKLVAKDHLPTRINRIFEKPIKRYLANHHRLKGMEELI